MVDWWSDLRPAPGGRGAAKRLNFPDSCQRPPERRRRRRPRRRSGRCGCSWLPGRTPAGPWRSWRRSSCTWSGPGRRKGTAVGGGVVNQRGVLFVHSPAYHFEKNDGQDSVDCEEPGHHHHDHGHGQVGAQHADGGDPAAVRKDTKRAVRPFLAHGFETAGAQIHTGAERKWKRFTNEQL